MESETIVSVDCQLILLGSRYLGPLALLRSYVLLHMNRMTELRIQIHTGFCMSSIFLKILLNL